MSFRSPLEEHEAPWRQVVKSEIYAGPRNGLRIRLWFDCGHTMTRPVTPRERRTLETQQCVGRCYPCWWKKSRPHPTPGHYHR